MRFRWFVACLLAVPAAAPAYVIQTGVFDHSGSATDTFFLNVQPGGHYRLEITLDKDPGTLDAEYRVDFGFSDCPPGDMRPECMTGTDFQPQYFDRVKVNPLLYVIDFRLPQLGVVYPGRYLNVIRDGGVFLAGHAQDQQTFDNYPIRYVVNAVPEPASWAMMVGGFGLLGAATRKARKVSRPDPRPATGA